MTQGRLVIWYVRITPDGVNMSGNLIFDEVNADWLIEKMDLAADDNLVEIDGDFDPDHFTVYVAGGDRGIPHNVNVLNSRLGTGPLGTVCGFCIDTPELAKVATSELRRILSSQP